MAESASASTVFVRNLPYDATDASLEEHFGEAGPVRGAFVVRDKKTKVSRGFGFIHFVLADDAQRAVELYNGKPFNGRNISVDVAKKGAKPDLSLNIPWLPEGFDLTAHLLADDLRGAL